MAQGKVIGPSSVGSNPWSGSPTTLAADALGAHPDILTGRLGRIVGAQAFWVVCIPASMTLSKITALSGKFLNIEIMNNTTIEENCEN